MKKTFFIRIDLESQKGIRKGVPRILEVLERNGVKGSFYLTMGGESNIFEILKNRNKLSSSGERKIKVWTLREKIRMVFFPKDFVRANEKILKRILEGGHELGLHGWKHREWTRNLGSLDVEKAISNSIKKYVNLFGKRPTSWSSPGFNTREKVLLLLEKNHFRFVSDFQEEQSFGNLKNLPLTILGKNKMPFIEYWVGEGKTDAEILRKFKDQLKVKTLASFYIHGLFEGRFKTELLGRMIKLLKKEGFTNKRVIDY